MIKLNLILIHHKDEKRLKINCFKKLISNVFKTVNFYNNEIINDKYGMYLKMHTFLICDEVNNEIISELEKLSISFTFLKDFPISKIDNDNYYYISKKCIKSSDILKVIIKQELERELFLNKCGFSENHEELSDIIERIEEIYQFYEKDRI